VERLKAEALLVVNREADKVAAMLAAVLVSEVPPHKEVLRVLVAAA
jgi:hypothetical protein